MSKSTSKNNTEIIETFSNFDESITTDVRNSYGTANVAHFYTHPDRLVPRIESISIAPDNASTVDLRQLNIGDDRSGADVLWGLSYASTNALWSKPSLFSGSWSKVTDLSTPLKTGTFLVQNFANNYYMNEDDELSRTTTGGSETDGFLQMEASEASLPFVKPVYHPEVNKWYFFDKYNIWENDSSHSIQSATDNNNASLQGSLYNDISAACVYNSFLAYSEWYKENNYSYIRIWNLNNTNPYVETFPGGDGEIVAMAELEGQLVSINIERGVESAARSRLSVRIFDGSGMKLVRSIEADGINYNDDFNIIHPWSDGYKLYFGGLGEVFGNSTLSNGVWSVDSTGTLTIEYKDDEQSTTGSITSFVKSLNTFVVTWGSSGDVYITNSNDATPDYSYPANYDTVLLDGNEPWEEKQMINIEVPHEPIPSGGSIEIQWRRYPDDKSWTSLKINNTTGSRRTIVDNMTQLYYESQIRIISNGVVVTTFRARSRFRNSKPTKK